jgi:hypothetical protein
MDEEVAADCLARMVSDVAFDAAAGGLSSTTHTGET